MTQRCVVLIILLILTTSNIYTAYYRFLAAGALSQLGWYKFQLLVIFALRMFLKNRVFRSLTVWFQQNAKFSCVCIFLLLKLNQVIPSTVLKLSTPSKSSFYTWTHTTTYTDQNRNACGVAQPDIPVNYMEYIVKRDLVKSLKVENRAVSVS